ncbi:uncharacterized protein L203_102712 [Cryptococcus depauperatus CBS 7841]|uniref:Uncharacterized protein n=1 Tax=Cryptococcus depauperatus CBS 7841 TaxID=1295531 RepID=A0AAJ8JSH9_9TREE
MTGLGFKNSLSLVEGGKTRWLGSFLYGDGAEASDTFFNLPSTLARCASPRIFPSRRADDHRNGNGRDCFVSFRATLYYVCESGETPWSVLQKNSRPQKTRGWSSFRFQKTRRLSLLGPGMVANLPDDGHRARAREWLQPYKRQRQQASTPDSKRVQEPQRHSNRMRAEKKRLAFPGIHYLSPGGYHPLIPLYETIRLPERTFCPLFFKQTMDCANDRKEIDKPVLESYLGCMFFLMAPGTWDGYKGSAEYQTSTHLFIDDTEVTKMMHTTTKGEREAISTAVRSQRSFKLSLC